MRFKVVVASSVVLALAVTACGGDSDEPKTAASTTAAASSAAGTSSPAATASSAATTASPAASTSAAVPVGEAKVTFLSAQAATDGAAKIMDTLTKKYGNASLKQDFLSTGNDQKIQLLASQDALPTMFHIGTPSLLKKLDEAGQIVDLEAKLTELGIYDKVNPAAVDALKKLYGGKLLALPVELNIEGFWYNKKIFADNGIAVPATWDELVTAAGALDAKGVQPFATSGKQGWPITRLVSGYLYRTIGPDAMTKVADGSAKLTDPEYIKAAQAVADLGDKGYFGKGVTSLDYDPAQAVFLSGKAAMFYMGSWALRAFNDPKLATVGVDNIGYFPFPAVTGGAGNIDQTPTNAGQPIAFTKKNMTPEVEAWLKFVIENFGDEAIASTGQITGVQIQNMPAEVSALTKQTLAQIEATKESVAWFEALFSPKATSVSQTNAAGLVTGATSPEKFMQTVQAAIDSE